MRVKNNITLSPTNSTRHLTGVIKIVILKLKNIITYRRVLPALVLPHLRKAQLGVPLQGRHPSVAISAILFISLIVATAIFSASTSALTYQDSVDVSFTFDPTLSISLSSNNISIDNLLPGNYAHSNTITINVSTNNVYGYTLTAKVGEDGGGVGTSASSDLVNNLSTTPFTSLSPNDRLALSNFANNTWGYTTSTNISDTATAYTGLLYNTDTTINMTKNSTGTALGRYQGTSTTNFTIGANASTDQLSGEYANILTFTAVTNVDVPPLCNPSGTTISTISCMQDINESNKASILASMTLDAQYQLVDSRDGNVYNIVKLIDNSIWMAQNLRYIGGIDGTTSAGNAINSSGNSFTMINSKNDSSTESRYYASGNADYGVYYNFCAASGGYICVSTSTTTYSSISICPTGWTLPGASFSDTFGGTSFSTLKNSGVFEVYAGYYADGSLKNTSIVGYWWSASANTSGQTQHNLRYNGSSMTTDSSSRSRLMPVRCVSR